MSDPLPLDVPEPLPAELCWYCGATVSRWEREHQTPVSREELQDPSYGHVGLAITSRAS